MNIIQQYESAINTSPLSTKKRQYLMDNGISLSRINAKYHAAKRRAETRATYCPPKNAFYRSWLSKANMLKYKGKLKHLADALDFDVHSARSGGYIIFELLPRAEHKQLHKQLRRQDAKQVLACGEVQCKHCGKIKPLDDFPKSTQSLTGIIKTCKVCSSVQRQTNKAFKDGRVA